MYQLSDAEFLRAAHFSGLSRHDGKPIDWLVYPHSDTLYRVITATAEGELSVRYIEKAALLSEICRRCTHFNLLYAPMPETDITPDDDVIPSV